MKKARINISHSRFILFKLKIFGEIVTTILLIIINKPNVLSSARGILLTIAEMLFTKCSEH